MSDLLTLTEAAQRLGVSADYLRKMVARTKRLNQQGKTDPQGIRFAQRGQGRIMFRSEWLAEYIERLSIDPMSPTYQGGDPKPAKENKPKAKPVAPAKSSNHGNNW